MKVLLIGGTGLLGRSFCRQSMHSDLQITALMRDADKGRVLQRFGVDVKPGSIFDVPSLRREIPRHDVILNFASAIPRKAKTSNDDWKLHHQIRIQGTSNILELIGQNDVFYSQAGFTFVYGDHQGAWVDEATALKTNSYTGSSAEMERLFVDHPGNAARGVSFRFSAFYHPEAWHTQYMIQELRKRRLPLIGDGNYYWNLIHVDDAASAVLTVLKDRHAIQGREIINVSDDQPVLCKDFLAYLCELFQVSPPPNFPLFVARLALGTDSVEILTASYKCATERIKSFGWIPQYASFREGFATLLQSVER